MRLNLKKVDLLQMRLNLKKVDLLQMRLNLKKVDLLQMRLNLNSRFYPSTPHGGITDDTPHVGITEIFPSAVRPVANFSKCCAARCKFFQVLCGPLQIFPSAVRPVANFSKCCAARCKFFQVLCGPKKIFDSMSAKKPSFLQRFRRFKTTTLLQMRLSITKPRSARRLIANETQSQEGQAIANETQSQ
jgi:hypothetical protein